MTYYKPAYACGCHMLVPEDYDIRQITDADVIFDHSIRCVTRDGAETLGYLAASEGLDEQVVQGGAEFWAGVCDYLTFDIDLIPAGEDPDFVVNMRNDTRLNLHTVGMNDVTREHILRYARAHSHWIGILPPDIYSVVDLRGTGQRNLTGL